MTDANEEKYKLLRDKLHELFQTDQADLDFGIYRIMNAKRAKITKYLDCDLKPQALAILNEVATGDDGKTAARMAQMEKEAKKYNAKPQDNPEYKTLREQQKNQTSLTKLEADVFSALLTFFERYYEAGDFISQRRYKDGAYILDHNGEEVRLHWANHDQYYIKTSEYFANYAFTLPDSKERVHFRLLNASTEQNNNKTPKGQERRFILSAETPIDFDAGELAIGFDYALFDATEPRADLAAQVLALLSKADKTRFARLSARFSPDKEVSVLEYHLNRYVDKHHADYFIHKDLGGFLRRELNFFIKNEVVHLDNILAKGDVHFAADVAKAKALSKIAGKIIDFLAELEEFQKKLWLKKKFVVETNWCMTLDMVDESFYEEILANEAQRAAWVKLFAIDELPANPSPDAGGGGGIFPCKSRAYA